MQVYPRDEDWVPQKKRVYGTLSPDEALSYLEYQAVESRTRRTVQCYESTHRSCSPSNGHYEDCSGYADKSRPIPINDPYYDEQAMFWAVSEIKRLRERVADLEAEFCAELNDYSQLPPMYQIEG